MGFHIILASNQTFFLGAKPDELHSSGWSVLCEMMKSFHHHGSAGHIVICTRAFRNRIIMSRYRNDFFWKISSQNAYCHIGGIAGNLALLNVQAALGCLFLHDFHCIQVMDRCAWKITCLAAVLGWNPVFRLIQRRAAYGYKAKCTCCFYFIYRIFTNRIADQHNCPICLGKTYVVSFSHEEKWCCDALFQGAGAIQVGTHRISLLIRLADYQLCLFLLKIRTLKKFHAGCLDVGGLSKLGCCLLRFLQNVFRCFVLPLCAGFTDVSRVSYKLVCTLSIWVNFCVFIHNLLHLEMASDLLLFNALHSEALQFSLLCLAAHL